MENFEHLLSYARSSLYLQLTQTQRLTRLVDTFLNEIKKIEKEAGRDSKSKNNMPRTLDIDILAIGNLQIHSGILEVPHPRISERKFVLKPWKDIAPNFRLPESSATIADLLDNTEDNSQVRMVLILDKENSN